MFDSTNILNSIASEIQKLLDNITIPSNPNAVITISRNPLTINSIDNPNQFYILLLNPRLSNLKFATEQYGSVKRHVFRINLFVVSQNDNLSNMLMSQLHYFFDKNEFSFTKVGLKKPKIDDFLKVTDSKYYSGGLSGNFSAHVNQIQCEVWV